MWKNGEVKIEKSVLPGKQAVLSRFGKGKVRTVDWPLMKYSMYFHNILIVVVK